MTYVILLKRSVAPRQRAGDQSWVPVSVRRCSATTDSTRSPDDALIATTRTAMRAGSDGETSNDAAPAAPSRRPVGGAGDAALRPFHAPAGGAGQGPEEFDRLLAVVPILGCPGARPPTLDHAVLVPLDAARLHRAGVPRRQRGCVPRGPARPARDDFPDGCVASEPDADLFTPVARDRVEGLPGRRRRDSGRAPADGRCVRARRRSAGAPRRPAQSGAAGVGATRSPSSRRLPSTQPDLVLDPRPR